MPIRSVSQKRTRTRTVLVAAAGSVAPSMGAMIATVPRHVARLRYPPGRVATKRRLPVLKAPPEADPDEPPRPPWQWVGFGTLAVFVVWLPLSWLATVAVTRIEGLEQAPVTRGLVFGAGLALAAMAGGFLVGRWGTTEVGVREAALAGLSAALVATVLAWGTAGFSLGALATVVFAVPPAALGGWLGLKRRPATW
jgi:hypothetical protein